MKDKNGDIYFQSFFTWFRYDGKKVEHHYDMNIHPLYFFEVEGNIYAQLLNDDFYQVQGRKFRRLISRQQVGGSHIVSAVSAGRGRMILSTQWQGLYKYENGILTSLSTEADAALKRSNVNRATFVPHDSTIVVGTILDGVYGFGLNGKLKWHYNMSNRLGIKSLFGCLQRFSSDALLEVRTQAIPYSRIDASQSCIPEDIAWFAERTAVHCPDGLFGLRRRQDSAMRRIRTWKGKRPTDSPSCTVVHRTFSYSDLRGRPLFRLVLDAFFEVFFTVIFR